LHYTYSSSGKELIVVNKDCTLIVDEENNSTIEVRYDVYCDCCLYDWTLFGSDGHESDSFTGLIGITKNIKGLTRL